MICGEKQRGDVCDDDTGIWLEGRMGNGAVVTNADEGMTRVLGERSVILGYKNFLRRAASPGPVR